MTAVGCRKDECHSRTGNCGRIITSQWVSSLQAGLSPPAGRTLVLHSPPPTRKRDPRSCVACLLEWRRWDPPQSRVNGSGARACRRDVSLSLGAVAHQIEPGTEAHRPSRRGGGGGREAGRKKGVLDLIGPRHLGSLAHQMLSVPAGPEAHRLSRVSGHCGSPERVLACREKGKEGRCGLRSVILVVKEKLSESSLNPLITTVLKEARLEPALLAMQVA